MLNNTATNVIIWRSFFYKKFMIEKDLSKELRLRLTKFWTYRNPKSETYMPVETFLNPEILDWFKTQGISDSSFIINDKSTIIRNVGGYGFPISGFEQISILFTEEKYASMFALRFDDKFYIEEKIEENV